MNPNTDKEMKHSVRSLLLGLGLLSTPILQPSPCLAQGTAFTYQGRLDEGNSPASGIYDLRFTIYDAATAGATVGAAFNTNGVAVSNGLFIVTLDFGPGVFNGAARWLEIAVRNNGGGAFTALSPRQAISPAPYAIMASQVSGPVAAAQLTGTISPGNIGGGTITAATLAPGAALANLNASGQAGVASGGIVLSATENPALVNAGYVKLDTMQSGNQWQARNASLGAAPPAARYGHSVLWTGTEFIIWGGESTGGFRNDGARYHPALNIWLPMSTIGAPTNRAHHTAVWTGTEMIVWGGTAGSAPLADGGRYDPQANTWTPLSAENALRGRSQHTAVWTGKEMIVWGGWDGTNTLNDGGRFNPGSSSWNDLATEDAPGGRSGHTAVWTGSEMIVWGGASGGVLNDGGRYNPDDNRWTSTTTGDAPSPRYEHTAVWTGTEMIVWGGSDGAFKNDGGRYLPGEDKWIPVNTGGAPAVRTRHTAVWTGDRMFVWGGLGASSTLNDGARYDPAGDSWSAAPTSGAPAARWLHTAVWTGTEMILWGGLDAYGGNPLNDGGRFYVPAEAWTGISSNAPVLPWPRTDATCVWTGSELLFWGGQLDDGHSYRTFNDGWRYQPTSRTVTAIPTNGAPTGRFAHSAVWTGSEMIIWGGNIAEGSGRVTNNGARYLPAANLWLPLNTTSSPSARAFHTAVWTGLDMIVWGGSSTGLKNGGLDDGSRYNPATDAWSPIATNNAPTRRFDHTAIWTGNEMIVWGGGTNLSTPVGSGARYHPGANVGRPFQPAAPRRPDGVTPPSGPAPR
jgi:N-acetylneuraminic acid mutarotase